MRPTPQTRRDLRPQSEDGFTIVEVIVAILILTIGLLGLIGGFDSARKLSLLSEQRTSMAHRAQLEIERLQAQPYSDLAMISTPSHSTIATNPDYYVNEGSTKYQYGEKSTEAESLVIAANEAECTATVTKECGLLSATTKGTSTERQCSQVMGACEWKDGNVSGYVYDFVTWYEEPSKLCKEEKLCPKRLTVVVTANVKGGNHEPHFVRVSTLVAEP
ncbi:MAG TPA: prepilin-type N-terminal cleavage/methylation domain-containing protein [Solirubrobacteraceae bacterium]|jgi:prepilin-type N-terminal cleavage/methylation domain-containing protein